MKKRVSVLSAILCLLMLFCMFSACENVSSPDRDSAQSRETSPVKGDARYPKKFTGSVNLFLQDEGVLVTVCEAYQDAFDANIVAVYWDGLDKLDLDRGTEISVTVLRVEENEPPTVYAREVSIVPSQTNTGGQGSVKNPYGDSPPAPEKPVIYLYPEVPTVCSVRLDFDGILTCTYPAHGENGWQNFTALPDGTLIFPNGREYYCLYWEGKSNFEPDFSKGFCVKGSDTAAFLQEILPKLGLTAREANEFIIYWLPILQNSPYNVISFQQEAYTDAAKLNISPAPDCMLRVFMAAYPVDSAVDIEPQEFNGFVRNGFTVVEWGGSYAGERAE